MAFIEYLNREEIPEKDRVGSRANILNIHSVHSEVIKKHYDLYLELIASKGPVSRIQRESVAVAVSEVNGCHY
jgi:hypothetical protein